MKKENLKKLSNYAKEKGCSVTWVNKLAEQKKVFIEVVDGVKFVDISKSI